MEKSKVFIVSSSKAVTLAEKLRNAINSKEYAESEVWTEVSRDGPSLTIMEMLENAAKEYDFAVIILNKDDIERKAGVGEEIWKARDNCIFEAGLFIGAMGRERCFLVTDLNSEALPKDLQGIIYKQIKGLTDFDDPTQCKKAIQTPSSEITDKIYMMRNRPRILPFLSQKELDNELKPNQFILPDSLIWKKGDWEKRTKVFELLSMEELFAKEEKESIGGKGELVEGHVVVKAITAQETKFTQSALAVKKNMDNGIRYVYYFPAVEEIDAQNICILLQKLLTADLLEGQEPTPQNVDQIIQNRGTDIVKSLQYICEKNLLHIYFLQHAPSLQFCLHNASNPARARAYVKVGNNFVKFNEGDPAYQFWNDIYKCGRPAPKKVKSIFHSVLCLRDDNYNNFIETLNNEISNSFPGIDDKVKKLCFGN